MVEKGFYCWRSNGNKIDLNRNWGFNHKKSTNEDLSYDANGDNNFFTQYETIFMN